MLKIIIVFTTVIGIVLSSGLISFHNIIPKGDTTTDQEFLCISDDLTDALLWNYPLGKKFRKNHIHEKPDDDEFKRGVLTNSDFVMDDFWQTTHSYSNPMGPVYHREFERFRTFMNADFKLLEKIDESDYKYNFLKKTGALVFSIRGPSEISIFVCESETLKNKFCYSIKINGRKNMSTVIQKCGFEIPKYVTNCHSVSDSTNTPIDFHEWKTFILKWEERKIELYDEIKVILTYTDDDYQSDNNSSYKIFFSNPSDDVIIRFHEYEYLYTTQIGSRMSTTATDRVLNKSQNFNKPVCIDLVVGLCNHCGLKISVTDGLKKKIATQEVFPDQAFYNLPPWKKVRIHAQNITNIVYPVKTELETFSTIPEKNLTGHWTVKQLAMFHSQDAFSNISLKIARNSESVITPIWCQRLSYDVSQLENLNLHTPLLPTLPDDNVEKCPMSKIGPHCIMECYDYFINGCNSLMRCTKDYCRCNNYYPGCQRGSKIQSPFIAQVTTTSAYAYFEAFDDYVKHSVVVGFELKAHSDDKITKRYAGRLGKSNNSDDKYYHTTFTNLRPSTEYSVRMYITYKYGNKTKTIMGETVMFRTLPMIQTALGIPALITMVQEGKGKATLTWRPPPAGKIPITSFLLYEEIIASKLEEKPHLNEKRVLQIPYVESMPEYVVHLDLLPSTHYRISIQAKGENVKGNLSTIEITSQSALVFKYHPLAVLDDENCQIKLVIPPVVNNTEHSMLSIIVKGSPICKQGGSLSSYMKKIIKLEDNEVSWMAATFSTYKTADKLFIVGDEFIYNDVIANCPLHPGNSYVIYLLVRERGNQNELQELPALLWISPEFHISHRGQHWQYWTIPLVVIIIILCGITYRYYKP